MAFNTDSLKHALKQSLDPVLKQITDIEGNLLILVHGAVLGVTNSKETVYLNSSGSTTAGKGGQPVESSTRLAFFSCTKAVTTTALLILVTQGKISLDAPITDYCPDFAKIKVVVDGKTTEPKTPVTLKHLLTHTSGFTYEGLPKFAARHKSPPKDSQAASLEDSFLSLNPGEEFNYGLGVDWAGFILEQLTGMSLGEYFQKYIFDPLDIHNTSFYRDDSDPTVLEMVERQKDSTLKPQWLEPFKGYREMGGHGLYGPVDDYLKFMRLWLNKGRAPNGDQLFDPKLYEMAKTNQLPPGIELQFENCLTDLNNEFSVAPYGEIDKWGLGFALTGAQAPSGKPKGTLHWCGVSNVYFWIDIENGIACMAGTQMFPGSDASSAHLNDIEAAIYKTLNAK